MTGPEHYSRAEQLIAERFPIGQRVKLKRNGRVGVVIGSIRRGTFSPAGEYRVRIRWEDTGSIRWPLTSVIEPIN
jgi:hypothetical protein